MTRSNPFKFFAEDIEIERITLQNLRTEIRERVEALGLDLEDTQSKNMVESHRTMFKCLRPSMTRMEFSIFKTIIVANNFEIKPNIIQMVQ